MPASFPGYAQGKKLITLTSETPVFQTGIETTAETHPEGNLWRDLQLASQAGNIGAFIHATQEIDWSQRTTAEIADAVRWALAAGAHLTARKLATEGAQMYPQDAELAKMARILAPPKYLGSSPADPSVGDNVRWLRYHAGEYRGQWLAVRNGQLVATALTIKQLMMHVEDRKNTLITKSWG